MKILNKFCILLIFLIYYNNQSAIAQTAQNRHHRGLNRTSAYNGVTRNDGFERLFDKMSNLENLNEQELRRLVVLEEKINTLEARNSEQLENVRSDLRNINLLTTKSDGNLDQLKSEIQSMKKDLDSNAHVQYRRESPDDDSLIYTKRKALSESVNERTLSEKLDALATLLVSTRTAILSAETTLDRISRNVTNLLQVSSAIHQRQHGQITRQYLNNALNSVRAQPSVYTVLQNPSTQSNPSFESNTPISCAHLGLDMKSGIHKIGAKSMARPFYVYCDMDTQDGGWTVIQNRRDGSINFNRNWLEYKNGFGNIAGDFFIGLDKLYDLTNHILYELLIVMEDFNSTTKYAKYSPFAIASEKEDYSLNLLGTYTGTAGDALRYSAGHKFSTFDNDNDGWVEGNCAQAHTGAWWYNACEMANLNGKYLRGIVDPTNLFQGIYWHDFHGPTYSLKSVKMLIRPIDRIFNPDFN